ncbi:MAG: FG-GAP-like repeat-containing protein [Candidatus Eisenbacteria bacterium]|nr:FG-GAP-like repeat-containing protein [Candidatus Eisenbacteria bacterium]
MRHPPFATRRVGSASPIRVGAITARTTRLLALAATLSGLIALATPTTARAADLLVTAVHPPMNGLSAIYAPVRITFDRAVMAGTVNASNIRIFGKGSGPVSGTFQISGGGTIVTVDPNRSWGAGETVQVNLGEGLLAADGMPLRAGGFSWQFRVTCAPSAIAYTPIDTLSNRTTPSVRTRIYGAAATDFNNDGSVDLATVNEISADVRVFLSLDDGTGLFGNYLPPQAIGVEASPNDGGDLDNDGFADLVVAASETDNIWIMLGNGDGTFGPITGITVGANPHGIVTIDLDGDADLDIAVACADANNISILFNDGAGVFGAPVAVEAGIHVEYGLATGDMNRDGRIDLVVGGRNNSQIRTLFNDGDGTFTPAGPAQPSGGQTWVVTLGDLNGDGHLDATTANSFSAGGASLLNLGNGTFGAPSVQFLGGHTVSTDLGDLDGDGDLDWILACFGGKFWRFFTNDGAGNFTVHSTVNAIDNPSCAIILDLDNDLDLDLALTDEIADVILLMKNTQSTGTPDPPPDAGRAITLAPNRPNPFAESTTLSYQLAAPARLTLRLFDLRGARLLDQDLGWRETGWNTTPIEARDRLGRPLGSGVYFYELESDAGTARGKLTIQR